MKNFHKPSGKTYGTNYSRFYGYPELLIKNFQDIINSDPTIDPELINCHYSGIVCVIGSTAYERAIKQITREYAQVYIDSQCFNSSLKKDLDFLNAKIQTGNLGELLKKYFGMQVKKKFRVLLSGSDLSLPLFLGESSCQQCESLYNNLIKSRHRYVHAGASNLPFGEACESFKKGKYVIACYQEALASQDQ